MPGSLRRVLSSPLPAALALALVASPAQADVASWLFVGGGPQVLSTQTTQEELAPTFQLDTGMGSSPAGLFSVGVLGRFHTRFGDGTDLGLLLRTATRGFVQGDFGLALDLGGYGRAWGSSHVGLAGDVALGAPWGITLTLGATSGPDEERTYAGVLGIDLARFTIYRSTGTGWWPNPFPTPRTERRAALSD